MSQEVENNWTNYFVWIIMSSRLGTKLRRFMSLHVMHEDECVVIMAVDDGECAEYAFDCE